MKIPEYKTVAGLRLANRDIGDGATQICIENTNEKECVDYARLLEECGFEKYEERNHTMAKEKAVCLDSLGFFLLYCICLPGPTSESLL